MFPEPTNMARQLNTNPAILGNFIGKGDMIHIPDKTISVYCGTLM